MRRLRLALLALPLSMWSALTVLPGRGPLRMPTDPGWAAMVASDGFALWIRVTLNAQVWLAVGIIALYLATPGMAPRWRLVGCASWFSGTAVYLPVLGLLGWGWPHMAPEAAAASVSSMVVTWLLFATITSIIGLLALAWGTWPADRAVAIGLALGCLAYVPGPWWLEFIGTAALALAVTSVTWTAWRG